MPYPRLQPSSQSRAEASQFVSFQPIQSHDPKASSVYPPTSQVLGNSLTSIRSSPFHNAFPCRCAGGNPSMGWPIARLSACASLSQLVTLSFAFVATRSEGNTEGFRPLLGIVYPGSVAPQSAVAEQLSKQGPNPRQFPSSLSFRSVRPCCFQAF